MIHINTFIALCLLLCHTSIVSAQVVGIGTNLPDNSAKLEISDNNRGLLIPRVNIPNLNAAAPITSPAVSLLVYNTNSTTQEGFYYWDGSRWQRLKDNVVGDHDWYKQGTTTAPNNINDNIYTQGRVGIGLTTPRDQLHVGGDTRLGIVSPPGSGTGLPSQGAMLIFSGASAPPTLYDSENSDLIWMGRHNVARDHSELRVHLGDNLQAEDALVVGYSNGGNFTPRFRLEATGGAFRPGGGSWGTLSDRRTKKAVLPFTDGLQVLQQINPVTFQYNGLYGTVDDEQRYVGIIAQEVAPVAPYMIEKRQLKQHVHATTSEEILQYDGGTHLLYILVNAVKEQQQIIALERTKNQALEQRLEQIEQRLQRLEGQ